VSHLFGNGPTSRTPPHAVSGARGERRLVRARGVVKRVGRPVETPAVPARRTAPSDSRTATRALGFAAGARLGYALRSRARRPRRVSLEEVSVAEVNDAAGLRRILESAKVVAVLGAHPDEGRPAGYVPAYLAANGYRIRPVNPAKEGERVAGEAVLGTLAEVGEPIDVLDVFRRSDALPEHLPEILALDPLPKVVWFQSGIRNDEVARALQDAGVTVVQDRCMKVEHRTLVGQR